MAGYYAVLAVLLLSLFCYVVLSVFSSFAIVLIRKRELVALLLLPSPFLVTVSVLLLFLAVPWVGLQGLVVVFPDHTPFFTLN